MGLALLARYPPRLLARTVAVAYARACRVLRTAGRFGPHFVNCLYREKGDEFVDFQSTKKLFNHASRLGGEDSNLKQKNGD